MIDRLRYGRPQSADRVLNHLIAWTAILLVLSVLGFGAYYYYDRLPGATGPTPVQQSIAKAEEAVRLNPEDYSVRMALANLYMVGERYPEAVEQYDAAATIDGKNLSPVGGLARALYEAGRVEESAANYQKIVDAAEESDLPPEFVGGARYYLARIALANGKPDDAIAHASVAVELDRGDADSWEILGAANVAAGKPDEAIAALSKATAFIPDFLEAYEQLALAYDQKGMASEGRYARAMQLLSTGKIETAASELEAVTKAEPAFASGLIGLGMAREKQGQKAKAIAAYQQALTLEANNFNARSGLARLNSQPAAGDSDTTTAHGNPQGGAQ